MISNCATTQTTAHASAPTRALTLPDDRGAREASISPDGTNPQQSACPAGA